MPLPGVQLSPQLEPRYPIHRVGQMRAEYAFERWLSVQKVAASRAPLVSRARQLVGLGATEREPAHQLPFGEGVAVRCRRDEQLW